MMTAIQSNLKLLFCLSAMTVFSCNSETETSKVEPAKTDSLAIDPPDTAAVSLKLPFNVLYISHKVKNYSAWKSSYLMDSTRRNSAGMVQFATDRASTDTSIVSLLFYLKDVSKAKLFVADSVTKDVMAKAGVLPGAEIAFYQLVRYDTTATANSWVTVTHKVKDYDAWLKVYDAEGKEARAKEGLIDAVVCRGIDDPNMVQLFFDVKDKKKAKASLQSEEKKKFMTSAGVIGVPKIVFHEAITDLTSN